MPAALPPPAAPAASQTLPIPCRRPWRRAEAAGEQVQPGADCCAATNLAPAASADSRGRTHDGGPMAAAAPDGSLAARPGALPKHLLTQWFDRHAPFSYLRGAPPGERPALDPQPGLPA